MRHLILIVCIICAIPAMVGCNKTERDENIQLNITFMKTFPFAGSIEEMGEWLEEHQYEYIRENNQITGEIANKWGLTIEEWSKGWMITLNKEGIFNEDSVCEQCNDELKDLFGDPVYESENLVRYANGATVIELRPGAMISIFEDDSYTYH